MLQGGPILRVDGLSKLYARREQTMRDRLGAVAVNALLGRAPPPVRELAAHEFWALDDVSFEVRRGEALGIIGLNGSGKTTLLRILAGQILPDRGSVTLSGTSAAMIDLQAGFQPNASGHDNIFLRAAALGFTRRQTEAMFDDIVAFSELGEAIGAPMSSYSSGMKMRLAFAVMAMVAPDILFIDEVLAVGDFRFRQKCLAKIREMRARSAFVLVSHAMGDVARFTDHVIVLHKGRIVFQGDPDEAIAFYYSLEQDSLPDPVKAGAKPLLPSEVDRPDLVDDLRFSWIGTTGPDNVEIFEGDPLRLKISFTLRFRPRNLVVGVPIYDLDGNVLTGFATDANGMVFDVREGDHVELEMTAPHSGFNPGHYRAAIGITDGTEFLNMRELPNLVVRPTGRQSWGTVSLPCQWRASVNSSQVAQA